MLAYIKGKIINKQPTYLVVENNGLGYKVFVSADVNNSYNLNDQIELHVFHNVKEDASDLFGFLQIPELKLFEQLISISGVGPKTALNIFNTAKLNDIISAILSGDAGVLKKVSGIGAKTAERIVLELKNKVSGDLNFQDVKSKQELEENSEAVEALVGLGFSANESRSALSQVDSNVKDVRERVRLGLRYLRK